MVVARLSAEGRRSPFGWRSRRWVACGRMVQGRLNRDQFFDKLAGMDESDLKKALWTLYWRGAAPVRQRIEAIIDPGRQQVANRDVHSSVDTRAVLKDVTKFASLARSGAYLAGDRRVSPQQRTRWRHTFRRLAGEAQEGLVAEDDEAAATALITMIELARETGGLDYFRSDDPLEAARFVVSDAVKALWLRMRQAEGSVRFAERAAEQLLWWESRYGWTRRGDGWVSARETSLAQVLSEVLVVPDEWGEFGGQYVAALDRIASSDSGDRRGSRGRQERAEDLSEWHALLVERLVGSEHEGLLDRLAEHPALAGPELTFLRARLARQRGERQVARTLVHQCLRALPGHREFSVFAKEVGTVS